MAEVDGKFKSPGEGQFSTTYRRQGQQRPEALIAGYIIRSSTHRWRQFAACFRGKSAIGGAPMSDSKRKPIGKSIRFDIFHRDAFTCQYCGRRPPLVTLELDHILAVANGGENDELNLITSCADCNAGKSAKILGEFKPTPDADERYLKAQQEAMEYARYLEASVIRQARQAEVIERIQDIWAATIPGEYVPAEHVVKGWLSLYLPITIEEAIEATAPANTARNLNFNAALRYASAVMRNMTFERREGR